MEWIFTRLKIELELKRDQIGVYLFGYINTCVKNHLENLNKAGIYFD